MTQESWLGAFPRTLARSFDARGTSGRRDYLAFVLILAPLLGLAMATDATLGLPHVEGTGPIGWILSLVTLPATVSLCVRRLRDTGLRPPTMIATFVSAFAILFAVLLQIRAEGSQDAPPSTPGLAEAVGDVVFLVVLFPLTSVDEVATLCGLAWNWLGLPLPPADETSMLVAAATAIAAAIAGQVLLLRPSRGQPPVDTDVF